MNSVFPRRSRPELSPLPPLAAALALWGPGCAQEAGSPASTGAKSGLPSSASASAPATEALHDYRILASRSVHEQEEPDSLASARNTEEYARVADNPFLRSIQNPLSTFSVDVDTASYANVRRFLMAQGMLPPPDAVRIEEMVNYFRYDDPAPSPGDDHPIALRVEIARCPWAPGHRLARIGLKAREIDAQARPRSSLVFLIDVSGSMDFGNKLPLLKRSMRLLVDQLGENDRVAVVVYAGAAGLALPPTSCEQKEAILSALDGLAAGGSTAGAQGIELAYQVAAEHFIPGGLNRVILCTDGDFNVGISDEGSLTRLIEAKAKSGVFLSVLGFGEGNLKDARMEALADKGNGNYAYIDSLAEANKVLVEQMGGTLVTVAKDVKIQVDFNPAHVAAYRLLGYENRMLRAEEFEDDRKDAGEMGAGHVVTALYELVPPGEEANIPAPPESKYVMQVSPTPEHGGPESLTVKLRYKLPDSDQSVPLDLPVVDDGTDYADASADFRFASSVAAFGMLLRDSPFKGTATLPAVKELASASLGPDDGGYRREFVTMIDKAMELGTPADGGD